MATTWGYTAYKQYIIDGGGGEDDCNNNSVHHYHIGSFQSIFMNVALEPNEPNKIARLHLLRFHKVCSKV